MTFLAIDAQKNLFTLQKSQLQYEMTMIMSHLNYTTKQMGIVAQELGDKDPEEDATYRALQEQESFYETRQDSIESQISIIDNEISGLKNLVNNNIKASCGLNLIGG